MEEILYSIYITGIPDKIANAIKGKRNVLVVATGWDKRNAALWVTEFNKRNCGLDIFLGDNIKFHYCTDNKIIWKNEQDT